MRKMTKKVVAFVLALAMAMPIMGMSASAKTEVGSIVSAVDYMDNITTATRYKYNRSSGDRTAGGSVGFSLTTGIEEVTTGYDVSNWSDGTTSNGVSVYRDNTYDYDVLIDLGEDKNVGKIEFLSANGCLNVAYGSESESTVTDSSLVFPHGGRVNNNSSPYYEGVSAKLYTNSSTTFGDNLTVTLGTNNGTYDKNTFEWSSGKAIRYILVDANGTASTLGEVSVYSYDETISTPVYTYEITAQSGLTLDKTEGWSAGDSVTVGTPGDYADGTLVVYDTTNKTRLTVADETFTMAEGDVELSYLTGDVVLGTYTGKTYARADVNMEMTFDITIPEGKVISSAKIYNSVKANAWNRENMNLYVDSVDDANLVANMVTEDRTVDAASLAGVDVTSYIKEGTNTFIVTNSQTSGIDYYDNNTATKASQLTYIELTYADLYELTIAGESYTADYNAKVTVTDTSSKFAYWVKNGKVVSTDATYSYYVWEDATINSVHTDDANYNAEYAAYTQTVYMTTVIGDTDYIYLEYWAKEANTGDCWYGIYLNPNEAVYNWQTTYNKNITYSDDNRQLAFKLTKANGASVYVSAENKTNGVQLKIEPEDKVTTGTYYAAR
ncbi:MAG: hypothetical protein ACI4CT_06115 [Lachnospiraceae bacterium]